jgi:MYXO-CTERM domain-containing protein
MFITYKVQDNAAPMTGSGSFTIPAPGAIALAGLAGLTGRRRR